MFYKKRIEELERTVAVLIDALEHNEAIGKRADGVFFGAAYTDNSNYRLSNRIKLIKDCIADNRRNWVRNYQTLNDLLDYLDLEYVKEPETKRLVKREKNILEQAKEHES